MDERDETHYSVDQYPVTMGAKFWNNDLRVCQITEVDKSRNDYPGGYTQTWHRTTHGSFDTMKPHNQFLGRLVRFYEGQDAEKYSPGDNFNDLFPRR
jgi:hypothetical protein